jgi:S-adenosylmethionine decarboxylase
MSVGTEWFVDAEGCNPELLQDANVASRVCEQIIAELGLHVVGQPLWHKFSALGGVTGLYLLSESHLTCHTYPENGTATFNLYCCHPRPRWPWPERLTEMLGATRVSVRCLLRGSCDEQDPGVFELEAAPAGTWKEGEAGAS